MIMKNCKYFLFIFILFFCSIVNAMDNEENDKKLYKKNISENRNFKEENPSLFVSSIKGTLEKSSEELSIFKKNFSEVNNIFSVVPCGEKDIENLKKKRVESSENFKQAKDKIISSAKELEILSQNSQIRIKNLEEFYKWLQNKSISISSGMNQTEIKNLIHNLKGGSRSLNASYSGNVGYNVSVSYSGYAPYKGNLNYSGYVSYSGSGRCGGWVCEARGFFHDKETCGREVNVSGSQYYSGNQDYSGSQYYSGSKPYSGTQSYSGNTTTTCGDDHHFCKCNDWAELIANFREVLIDYDGQKQKVKKIHNEIGSVEKNINNSEKITQETLITFENDKIALRENSKRLSSTFGMFSSILENREKSTNQILNIVIDNEEEQRKEKENLKLELGDVNEEYKKKSDKVETLLENNFQIEREKSDLIKKHMVEKHEIEKLSLLKIKDIENYNALLESKTKALLMFLTPKINNLTKDDKRKSLSIIKEEKTMVDIIDDFMNFIDETQL